MTPRLPTAWLFAVVLVAALLAAGCDRERRPFRDLAADSARVQRDNPSELQAGPVRADARPTNPYLGNAWAVGEGKRLFSAYNCTGCHAHGGGAIGPALTDEEWIYGYDAGDIYKTIVEGRPNGMPAFGGKIPDYQVWQLAAYVDSMSGQLPIDVAPGRSDQMKTTTPENNTPFKGRRVTGHK